MGDTPISQEIEAHDQDNLFGIHALAIDDTTHYTRHNTGGGV